MLAVLRIFGAGGLALALVAVAVASPTAEGLYRQGFRAQRQGRHLEAYLLYNRARALAPADPKYLSAVKSVRRGAAQLLASAGAYGAAIEVDPGSREFDILRRGFEDAGRPGQAGPADPLPQPAGPPVVSYKDHQAAFRLRGTLREAYEEVAREFGVRFRFHEDFAGEDPVRADLSECGFPCAIRALGEIGGGFVVPLESDLLLVAADSEGLRRELETAALALLPLDGGLAPEEISEVLQAIQGILDLQNLHSLPSGVLVVRDSVTKVEMARHLADGLLHPPGVVQVEVRMVAVSANRERRFGADLPATFAGTSLGMLLGNAPDLSGSQRMIGVGGGRTALGISVGDASVLATLSAGEAESIQSVQVRAQHGAPAEFKVGERYPIATAQYSSGGAAPPLGAGGSSYIQPPPAIQFEDLGLSLAFTPAIHSALEVTLEMEVSFKFLAGGAVNGVPVVANREFRSQVRLRSGSFAVVSGMSLLERRSSGSGLAGLARIPLLGGLFRTRRASWDRRDLLVLVRPSVVRLPAGELAGSPSFLFGSEQRPAPWL